MGRRGTGYASYGACYHDIAERLSTGVIEFLRQKSVTTVIVGGLATDYCVKTTVMQLLRADFQVIVNMAACRGLTPATTQRALAAMRQAEQSCSRTPQPFAICN